MSAQALIFDLSAFVNMDTDRLLHEAVEHGSNLVLPNTFEQPGQKIRSAL